MASLWYAQFERWVQRRTEPVTDVTLTQARIFIVPTKMAAAFLMLVVVLFVLAVNFQNSLIYAVSFWLLALLLVNVFYTYRNLAGLQIKGVGIAPCFVGDEIQVELDVLCPVSQQKFALNIGWDAHDAVMLDLAQTHVLRQVLTYPTRERGYFYPPRLRIKTEFPTGLAVAWAYVQLDMRGVVYPKPRASTVAAYNGDAAITTDSGRVLQGGTQDFGGVRDYQQGDAPKHIHWVKYAQTQRLYTKTFVDYAGEALWLDWYHIALPLEMRLEHLSYQVVAFSQQQRQFGLRLPHQVFAPNCGDGHKAQCLKALALYGIHDE